LVYGDSQVFCFLADFLSSSIIENGVLKIQLVKVFLNYFLLDLMTGCSIIENGMLMFATIIVELYFPFSAVISALYILGLHCKKHIYLQLLYLYKGLTLLSL